MVEVNQDISLVPFKKEYSAPAHKMSVAAYGIEEANLIQDFDQLAELSFGEHNYYFLAITFQDKLAGYLCAYEEPNKDLVLADFVLDKAYRGQGVAKLILRSYFELINAKRKIRNITLHVRFSSEPAIKCFASLGFKVTETEEDFYEDGETAYAMKLKY